MLEFPYLKDWKISMKKLKMLLNEDKTKEIN